LADIRDAVEAFLASTTREVQAVAAIEDGELPGAPGERTRAAAQALRSHIEEELQAVRA
jgi:branched-subunit amino acid aminotransferase/4-amino-4-deoxychorismate lyase